MMFNCDCLLSCKTIYCFMLRLEKIHMDRTKFAFANNIQCVVWCVYATNICLRSTYCGNDTECEQSNCLREFAAYILQTVVNILFIIYYTGNSKRRSIQTNIFAFTFDANLTQFNVVRDFTIRKVIPVTIFT